ncbi:hypothetical protein CMV_018642 [Castanea mollissima]|uniref:Uncharacterized protein n=1 Tax=Castanea mollissima TaxID=60419 RepID=A0A8J4QP76_9ROSI|nr:hypothetical protein CMV_018642 [Castanea mollissima]
MRNAVYDWWEKLTKHSSWSWIYTRMHIWMLLLRAADAIGPPRPFSRKRPSLSAGPSRWDGWLILILSWASLAHFIPLGILGPFHSFGYP